MTVFLSYSWRDKEIANKIDFTLTTLGVTIIRDVQSLQYKDNIKQFMSSIRETDYAIILLSDSYLKSPNCLFELIELSKEKEFANKILPLLTDDCNIFAIKNKIYYINFWKEKVEGIKVDVKQLEPTKAISILKEIKHYEVIYSNIDDFLNYISDIKNIKFSDCITNGFKDLLLFIGIDNREIEKELIRIESLVDEQEQDLHFEALDRKYPDNSTLVFAKGYLHLAKRKNYIKAKEYFETYIFKLNNHTFAGYNNLGLTYSYLERYDTSEKYYKKALEIKNNAPQALANLGVMETKRGNFRKAIEYYMKSNEIKPLDGQLTYNMARIFSEFLNETDRGIEYYEKAIQLDPSILAAYNNLAANYLFKNEIDKGLDILEQGIKIKPDHIMFFNMGRIYETEKKDILKAKEYYRKSIRTNFSYIPPKLNLAVILIQTLTDIDEASELLNDILSIDENNAAAIFNMGNINLLKSNTTLATEYFDKAASIDPSLKNFY